MVKDSFFEKKPQSSNIKTEVKDETPLTKKDKDLLTSGHFNYGLRQGQATIEGHGLVPYLRRKALPIRKKFEDVRFRLEESSRIRRRVIYGSCLVLMCLSLVSARIWTKGIIIMPTPQSLAKKFVNGDTVKILNSAYDKDVNAVRIDVLTSSPTGIVSPENLLADFQIANPPKEKQKAPLLYLIPTFNNHFVIIVKNLYPNFGGLKIQFHNTSTVNLAQVSNAVQNGNNGTSPQNLKFEQKVYEDANAGGLHLTEKQINTLNNSTGSSVDQTNIDHTKIDTASHQVSRNQLELLDMIQKNNTQYILVSEKKMKSAKFKTVLNAKYITITDLQKEINRLNKDIKTNKDLIEKDKPYIANLKQKIESLNKDKGIDPSFQAKIDDAKSAITSTEGDIKNYNAKISLDQRWIDRYQERIDKLNNGQIATTKVHEPSKAVIFNSNEKK